MSHKLVALLLDRAENDKHESDFAYFFALLLAGEALSKTVTLGTLAAIEDDIEANRYRLIYQLVRANGLGEWGDVIEDALSGPASQFLVPEAREDRTQLTELSPMDTWQYESVNSLQLALDSLSIRYDPIPRRTNLIKWFRMFTLLRNKTRGHGATRPLFTGLASAHLFDSIRCITSNLSLIRRPWAFLYRNLSGKYRVTPLTNDTAAFDFLKSDPTYSLPNGVYVYYGGPKLVHLITSDPDISDYFLPNGGFNDKRFDLLSYVTDNRQTADSSPFLIPPDLHKSETHGRGELLPKGKCLSNAPDPGSDYVPRPALESTLFELLMDDRHPVITLQGAGGVGKTSSTLQIIDRISNHNGFELIVWFSARDIDLLTTGPRTVRPGVLSREDMANQYSALVLSEDKLRDISFDSIAYFQDQLTQSDGGNCLFVFDNFETVRNPVEMFTWIEHFIRLPNKALVTTRLRDFRGDYPLEVYGMTDEEAKTLIQQTVTKLHIHHLVNKENIEDIVTQSNGHPYVIKMLLGEIADKQRFASPRHVVAASDEVLTVLFERTFTALSPCGQRAFMTLAAWHSAVPRIALEAVLIQSTQERTEVENGIESLLRYSLAEERITGQDRQAFIGLPLAAHAFGKRQLQINRSRAAIEHDVQILQMFSPNVFSDTNLNLEKGVISFIRNIADRIDRGDSFENYEEILKMVCRAYNPGWLHLAEWHLERGSDVDISAAISSIETFIQNEQDREAVAGAWRMLARAYFRKDDALGEVLAFVERAQFGSVPFYDLSNTANLLNRKYGQLKDSEGRERLVERLLRVMESRIDETVPDDLSAMAWLALHLSDVDKAKMFVERGLSNDSQNPHLLKFASRLAITV